MKKILKILIVFIIFGISFGLNSDLKGKLMGDEKLIVAEYNVNFNYTYSFAKLNNNEKDATNISHLVQYNARKFNIDPRIFTKLIYVESEYRQNVKSYKLVRANIYDETGTNIIGTKKVKKRYKNGSPIKVAYGLTMVYVKYWGHKLKDKNLFPELVGKIKSKRDIEKYILMPKYNIRLGAHILNYYLKQNNHDYELALTAYWSGNGYHYKRLKHRGIHNEYMNMILCDKYVEKRAKRHYDWKLCSI
jgi:hypothetical protein